MTAGDATEEQEQEQPATEAPAEQRPTLTAAMRRELLAELATALGDGAVVEGEKLIAEAGQGVALYARVEPSGTIVLTWWMTAMSEVGHPRWREVAAELTNSGEHIYTSALGGGYLVEVEHPAATVEDAVRQARASQPVERVQELIAAFPDAIAALPPEEVPDYLLPPVE